MNPEVPPCLRARCARSAALQAKLTQRIRAIAVTGVAAFAASASAHDGGSIHHASRAAMQVPVEMLESLGAGKGIPSADSEAVKAMASRYLSRRSNRSSVGDLTQTGVPTTEAAEPQWQLVTTPFNMTDALLSDGIVPTSFQPPAGNGLLMAASFAPFKPKVRFNWDPTTFFVESDNTPDGMPNKMVGITTWQQQVPIPAAYFAHSTSNENNSASLGYQQPNYWRIPLVPVPSASPIVIYNPPAPPTNFLRGAVALASNGIAIFNPSNNGGNVSYEIGELDFYGGHCGLADDYHYHIIPTHLNSRFGGPLADDKPVAWALDGYPIYGYLEPDGSPRQALDAEGGHDIGNGWGYH